MVGVQFDTATTALCSKRITQAESEINKYLSRRYDLSSATFQTTTSIPPLVTALCERLTEGYMWQSLSRGGASKELLKTSESIIKSVIDNLKLIADYKGDLFDTSGSVVSDMSNTAYRVLSNTDTYVDTFAEDDELNWAVDPDKLDDISSERG
jgi:hypothetical protein